METKHLEIHDLANVVTLIDGAAKQAELKEQAPAEDNVSNIADEDLKVESSSE